MREIEQHHPTPVPTAACEACGEQQVSVVVRPQRFSYGVGRDAVELSVDVPVHECSACGMSYTDDTAEELRHAEVCRHLDVLTPAQIKAIRRLHDVTQDEFSSVSRIGIASLARWETGAVIQNSGYDEYLRLLGDPEIFLRVRQRRERTEMDTARYEGPRSFPSLKEPDRARARQELFSLHR